LLRDIRARLPELQAVKGFGLSAVPSLHEAVAKAVVVSPLDEFATAALARKTVVGRSLWEGEPALPGSPSAGAFKFLRNLTVAMSDAGGDLWSPAAVGVLKRHLGEQISKAWLEVLGTLDGPKEGEAKADEGPERDEAKGGEEDETEESPKENTDEKTEARAEQQDLLVQWLMDIYYLRLFLGSDNTKALEAAVYQKSGLEASAKEKLAKASQDYFKRTGLLFGLLT
jgi:hypothetical protein